jgi:hypothetical protein
MILCAELNSAGAIDMKIHRKTWVWIILLASLAFLLQLSTFAKAQDQDGGWDDQGDQDPPGRVARLNFSQGNVSFRPGGEDDWVTAVPNRPLITGDDLWADDDSRAELHVGSAAIRLGSRTGITFLDLDDHTVQIRLAQGSLILRVRHVDDDDAFEVDTPNLAFALLQPGTYRLNVSEDGNRTVIEVWNGRGRVTGGGFSYTVLGRQKATFTGSDHLDYDLDQLPYRDDFDRWAFDRDDREDRADTANYVSREMTGYEDLDEYGDWTYVAGYGECWRPRGVMVDWAPYRYGHWVWVGGYGWTWVEDEPWGFAPFHYGRWAFVGGGWFWVPGPVVVRPVWAPALVAFVGGGGGFRFSAGVGVGWFPLAPGEVFVPSYRVSRTYVNNVNITNTTVEVTKVTNVYNTVVINKTTVNNITYVNQHVNNGVTVVSHDAFVNSRPVAKNVMHVEPREIVAAPVTHISQVEPVRQSVIGAGRPAPVRPPAAIISRPVVAQRTPPPAPRPFNERQQQAGGHLAQQPLVRPEPPARPYPPTEAGRPQPTEANKPQPPSGFRPFTPAPPGNPQVKQVQPPRSYEAQGNPPPPETNPAQEPRNEAPPKSRGLEGSRPPQPAQPQRPTETHPLVRPTPPVQPRTPEQEQQQEQKFRQWQQQRPATPPPPKEQPKQQPSHPAENKHK